MNVNEFVQSIIDKKVKEAVNEIRETVLHPENEPNVNLYPKTSIGQVEGLEAQLKDIAQGIQNANENAGFAYDLAQQAKNTADQKLDKKVRAEGQPYLIYGIDDNSNPRMFHAWTDIQRGKWVVHIPMYHGGNSALKAGMGSGPDDVVINKQNDLKLDKYTKEISHEVAIVQAVDGQTEAYPVYSDIAWGSSIVKRQPQGTVVVAMPKYDNEATSKQYVDEKIDNLQYKTLFGNQSILGQGNIDLFRHHLLFTPVPDRGAKKFKVIYYSSKNLKVDSLTDLKTLTDNTDKPLGGFQLEVTGEADNWTNIYIEIKTLIVRYMKLNGNFSYMTLANFTVSDEVEAI